MSTNNKSIFLLCVMVLALFFSPAQGVVIKKECSPSRVLGYLKCGLAGGFGFNTIVCACFLSYLATLDFELNWMPATFKPEAQSVLSFIKHSMVTGGSFAVLSGAYATKIIYDSAQDNFEAIAQQERDILMEQLAFEQQQQQVQQLQPQVQQQMQQVQQAQQLQAQLQSQVQLQAQQLQQPQVQQLQQPQVQQAQQLQPQLQAQVQQAQVQPQLQLQAQAQQEQQKLQKEQEQQEELGQQVQLAQQEEKQA